MPFGKSKIEPLGQPTRKENRLELIPYKVRIEISGYTFPAIDPKDIHPFNDCVTEYLDGNGRLIILAKTPEEARKKASEIVKLKYYKSWDGHGEDENEKRIYMKPHHLVNIITETK